MERQIVPQIWFLLFSVLISIFRHHLWFGSKRFQTLESDFLLIHTAFIYYRESLPTHFTVHFQWDNWYNSLSRTGMNALYLSLCYMSAVALYFFLQTALVLFCWHPAKPNKKAPVHRMQVQESCVSMSACQNTFRREETRWGSVGTTFNGLGIQSFVLVWLNVQYLLWPLVNADQPFITLSAAPVCELLPTPINAVSEPSDCDISPKTVGSVCYHFCRSGYSMVDRIGSYERACTNTGKWTGSSIICKMSETCFLICYSLYHVSLLERNLSAFPLFFQLSLDLLHVS